MKHKILSAAMSGCLIFNLAAVSLATFDDMPNNYATPALEFVVEKGLMEGYDGNIMPTETLTRAQMGAVLVRAFAADELEKFSEYSNVLDQFSDVDKDAWYYPELSCAVHMGYFLGDGNGAMSPNAPITRQEVFVVLARAFGLQGAKASELDAFADADSVTDWAVSAVAAMVKAGYVIGDGEGLKPLVDITRQDFAVVLYRALNVAEETTGGGNGGGGSSTTYYDYTVDGTFTVSALSGTPFDMTEVNYNNYASTNSGKTIAQVGTDLLDANETLLSNTILAAMNLKVYGQSKEIVKDGVPLVASISKKVGDVGTDGIISVDVTPAYLNSTKATLEGMIRSAANYLPEADEMLADLDAVANMQELAAFTADLKDLLANMGQDVSAIPVIPAIPTLGEYLVKAETKYAGNEATFIAKLNSALGFTMTEAQETAAKAVYAVGDPTAMVTAIDGGEKLQLATHDVYYALLEDMVDAQCALWVALGSDLTAERYEKALDVVNGVLGITVEADVAVVTAHDGFFTSYTDDTLFSIEADLDAAIADVLDRLDIHSDLTAMIPAVGTCDVTVTIARS